MPLGQGHVAAGVAQARSQLVNSTEMEHAPAGASHSSAMEDPATRTGMTCAPRMAPGATYRTTMTGTVDLFRTFCATLPIKAPLKPLCP